MVTIDKTTYIRNIWLSFYFYLNFDGVYLGIDIGRFSFAFILLDNKVKNGD